MGNGCQTTFGKEVNSFYVWPVRGNSGPPYTLPVERSGVSTSYRTGDDGYHQAGVPWASTRFSDNGNGTVTDNNTGLIWLKNPNPCGVTNWDAAITYASTLASGMTGLSDGSVAGDWRLPNVKEFYSLFAYNNQPVLPTGHPFAGASDTYWLATTSATDTNNAYWLVLYDANTHTAPKTDNHRVWPVRAFPQSTNVDTDGDNLPDWWEKTYFGSATGAVASDDVDGDGFTNLQEYLAGTDPLSSLSSLRIKSIQQQGDDVQITWNAPCGKTNVLQGSVGTADGSFSNSFTNLSPSIVLPGVGECATNYLDVGAATNAPSRFYRVRLVP